MSRTTVLEASSIKDLGVSKSEAKEIKNLYCGNKHEQGIGARAISESIGVSRRKVMRTLELLGVTSFAGGSYA